jgi:uncharacterized protein involved in outer membrane biogenesis
MNRTLFRIAWIGGILLIILIIGVGSANYYINRPVFKNRVEKMVTKVAKMPVEFETLKIRWDGIQVKNLTLPYADGKSKTPFAQVDDLGLSFSFLQLLTGKVVLDAILVDSPRITLQEFADGKGGKIALPKNPKKIEEKKNNKNKKNEEKEEAVELPATEEPDLKTETPKQKRFGIDEVEVEDGVFQFVDAEKKTKVLCEGIEASGNFLTAPEQLQSQGKLSIENIVIEPNLKITSFQSPISYTNEILILPSFEADLYEGNVSGRFRARFDKEQKPFRSKIQVRDFDLKTFLEARSDEASPIEGKADLNFEGQGAFEDAKNIVGKGDFLVRSFEAEGLKFFRQIGAVVGVPGLSDITFDEVIGNFYIKDQQVIFEKVETQPKGSTTYMEGRGMIDFEGNLNFSGSITLNSGLIGELAQLLNTIKIKGKEGMITIPFTVTGTTDDPKIQVISTDLAKETMKGLLDLIPVIKF